MINGLSFDIEDWFQVENLQSVCPFDRWDTLESRVERNTDILLGLLRKYNQKATFFVLGWIAERRPALVEKITKEGHEIASHGYKHEIIYKLSPNVFSNDLEKSKIILEGIVGKEVIGYRAPNFSITEKSRWAVDILKEQNFKYDSSIFPTSFHNRYGFDELHDSAPFKFDNGLQEFPLTVYRVLNFNFPIAGGAYFRLIPYKLLKLLFLKINKRGESVIFYLHPWELDNDQPRLNVKRQYYIRHYANLDKTEYKLNFLLRDFKFQPLKDFLSIG